jgi:hypothetical protein
MIGELIVDLLKDNGALLALVDADNIFPYVVNEKTKFPFIVYNIESLESDYTKDGWAGDLCSFSIISVSDDYANLQAIVAQVREAIELKNGTNTQRIILSGMLEGFNLDEEAFMNKLSFRVKITS